jgi:hydrogenase maturation protease
MSAVCAPAAVLVAGVGNIFAGDDAFGVEVVQRLAQRRLPAGVRVVDFGTRAVDLAYALQDQCDALVLVDAAARGAAPGTLYVIEPQLEPAAAGAVELTHALNPQTVLRLLSAGPTRCRRALIVGCEPQNLGDQDDICVGLSGPVTQALGPAVELVHAVVLEILEDNNGHPGQDDRNPGGLVRTGGVRLQHA